ncbi:MAG: homoserine dehydrogenase [Alphaproteobacteria bacterium]|nr:homoserine dehydrogenase [Alphaproteobacteria bacterium]|tara:strand:+ start:12799 stop:14091 length:1293 start_codon:yes stop_codon:yes gene_type:complete
MAEALRIGLAGLGNVGAGVFKLLEEHSELLASRCGRSLEVVAVSARDRSRDRGFDFTNARWCDDPRSLAEDGNIDVVVELIGGSDGVALQLVEDALASGKNVVTANKAMLALHGTRLASKAEESGVGLAYEAAVAGGIPIVKSLREGLAGNRIERVYGILNGTCNYILTAMEESGREFDDVLSEAQSLGYAEADPSFDVDGIDAAHKLALLTSLAFGRFVEFDTVYTEGIRQVGAIDIDFARELGFRIKLLAIARATANGIEQRVHPCLISTDTPIAHVQGVFNAVVAEGDYVDRMMYEGRGAGEGPTASAVVADLVDLARGDLLPTFGVPVQKLESTPSATMEEHESAYYVRLMVVDKPGVMADVAAILRDENVSLESVLQRGRDPGEVVPVILTTHVTVEAGMRRALQQIGELELVVESPLMIRVEDL